MTRLISIILAMVLASPALGGDETRQSNDPQAVTKSDRVLSTGDESRQSDDPEAMPRNDRVLAAISYVRSDLYHGVNYTVARSFGPDAVSMLLEMLEDEKEKESWANIINVLGMIGGPKVTGHFIEFLERRFNGDVDQWTWKALLAVLPSMGFLATDPKSEAFKYLSDGMRSRFWEKRDLQWTYPALNPGEREILLTKLTINGLGIAGNSEAEELLQSFSTEKKKDKRNWVYYSGNMDDALTTIDKIRRLGHERMFGMDAR